MTRYHRLHLFSGSDGRMVQCQSYKTPFGIGKLYNMVQGTCSHFIISIFSILLLEEHAANVDIYSRKLMGGEPRDVFALYHQEGLLLKNATATSILLISIHLQVPYCNKALLEKRIQDNELLRGFPLSPLPIK